MIDLQCEGILSSYDKFSKTERTTVGFYPKDDSKRKFARKTQNTNQPSKMLNPEDLTRTHGQSPAPKSQQSMRTTNDLQPHNFRKKNNKDRKLDNLDLSYATIEAKKLKEIYNTEVCDKSSKGTPSNILKTKFHYADYNLNNKPIGKLLNDFLNSKSLNEYFKSHQDYNGLRIDKIIENMKSTMDLIDLQKSNLIQQFLCQDVLNEKAFKHYNTLIKQEKNMQKNQSHPKATELQNYTFDYQKVKFDKELVSKNLTEAHLTDESSKLYQANTKANPYPGYERRNSLADNMNTKTPKKSDHAREDYHSLRLKNSGSNGIIRSFADLCIEGKSIEEQYDKNLNENLVQNLEYNAFYETNHNAFYQQNCINQGKFLKSNEIDKRSKISEDNKHEQEINDEVTKNPFKQADEATEYAVKQVDEATRYPFKEMDEATKYTVKQTDGSNKYINKQVDEATTNPFKHVDKSNQHIRQKEYENNINSFTQADETLKSYIKPMKKSIRQSPKKLAIVFPQTNDKKRNNQKNNYSILNSSSENIKKQNSGNSSKINKYKTSLGDNKDYINGEYNKLLHNKTTFSKIHTIESQMEKKISSNSDKRANTIIQHSRKASDSIQQIKNKLPVKINNMEFEVDPFSITGCGNNFGFKQRQDNWTTKNNFKYNNESKIKVLTSLNKTFN